MNKLHKVAMDLNNSWLMKDHKILTIKIMKMPHISQKRRLEFKEFSGLQQSFYNFI